MEILSLGEKIRRKRKSLRLTLKDVAGDNVTPAQLSYVESNKCKPSSNLLKYICSKIELDMGYALESECDQAAKYCDYFLKEYEFYVKRGELKEALNKLSEIERFALEYHLDKYLGIVAYNRGVDFIIKEDYDSAQCNLLIALQIFMGFNDISYIYNCYQNLGAVALKKIQLSDALEFYRRSLEIGHKVDNGIYDYNTLFGIAKVYHRLRNVDEARKQLLKVITDVLIRIDEIKEPGLIMEIVEVSAEVFNSSMFEKHLNDFNCLYKAVDYKNGDTTLDILKSIVYIKEKDFKTGIELLNSFMERVNGKIDEYQLTYLLRMAYMMHKTEPECSKFILSKISNTNMSREQYALFLFIESQIIKNDDSTKAIELLVKAQNTNDESKNKCLSVLINKEIGELCKQAKKYQESINCLLRSAQLLSTCNAADYELYFT